MTEINKYNNSKIYKIQCRSSNKIYIGSTCQSLAQRLSEHVNNYKHYQKNDKSKYISSYEILNFKDYEIVLLENCNFNNKQQLHEKEGYYIQLNKEIVINNRIAGRKQEQYNKDNYDLRLRTHRQYNIEHKEHIKKYNIEHKEHKKEYDNKYRRLKKQKQNEIVNSNIVLFEEQITILHKSFELPKINVLEKNLKILYKKQLNYYNSLFK